MDTIVIDADNNNLKIDGTPYSATIKSLFDEFNEKFGNGKFFRAKNFRQLNQLINRGDCIKDGTNGATITNFDLFDVNNTFSEAQLLKLKHAVIEKGIEEGVIIRQTFTKDKRGDNSVKEKYNGLSFDIGYDVGLGLENYLMSNQYKIIDTFGKYIDPSLIGRGDSSGTFPEKKILVITENAFNMLGYDNCSIESAVQKGKNQYDYEFILAGVRLSNKGKSYNQDSNIRTYFAGNKVKNNVNGPTNLKKSRIVGKSLGDKLQVFIMFIKKIEQKNQTKINAISTNDETVFMFCVLLKLACFYTSTHADAKKINIDEVLYYNVDNTSSDKAMIRFENEKKIVIKGYSSMISMIEKIRKNNSPIKLSSDNRKYTVSPQFSKGLIDDLTYIKNEIEKLSVGENARDISKINKLTQQIKLMTINNFIRENEGAGASGNNYFIAMSCKKYTKHEPPQIKNTAYGKVNLLRELGMDNIKDIDKNIKLSFFELLKQSQTPPSVIAQGGENISRKRKSSSASPSTKSVVYKNIEEYFNTDEIIVYLKPDEIVNPSDENVNSDTLEYYDISSFDANRTLLDTLYDLYINMNSRVPFEDIYSEMLCLFNSDPNYYTEHLKQQMEVIEKELQSAFTIPSDMIEEHIPKKQKSILPSTVFTSVIRKITGTPGTRKSLKSRTKRNKDIRSFTRKKLQSIFNKPQTNSLRNFPESIAKNITSIL